jgi:NAD(P)-dependent dehydrogenase (short-subunit alcohol dehydrogenase family)
LKELADKIALVTGAGSGIGRATAQALAGAGATVVATDCDAGAAAETAAIIQAGGLTAYGIEMDVSKPPQVRQVASQVLATLGCPGVLVNNAGISVGGLFLDSSEEAWDRIISINLMGVVHCCRAFLPAMVEQARPAHIVNVSSLLGFTGMRGVSAYCTTKFGVLGFSESLRAELAGKDIGVSAICPGIIRTNIISNGLLEASDVDLENTSREINEFYEKRNYPPERVASAILRAIHKNRAMVPVTPEAWGAYYLKRFAPGLMAWLGRREWV